MIARLLCWWLGHRWTILEQDPLRSAAMVHLHTMAGTRSRCLRCGAELNDMPRRYSIPDGYRIADLPISERKKQTGRRGA